MTNSHRSPSRRVVAGLGALAASILILAAGLLLGAEFSADQPLAPALVAGGFGLIALFVGRQGVRLIAPPSLRS